MDSQALIEIFLTEARELTATLEDGLLKLEQGRADDECIHSLFRAAHTIKGSAGVVGLTDVMKFTHLVESAFELLRSQQLELTPPLLHVLIGCNDHINLLLDLAGEELPEALCDAGALWLKQLQQFLPETEADSPSAVAGTSKAEAGESFLLSIGFGSDTFRHGFDPVAIVRYLRGKAEIEFEHWSADHVPSLPVSSAELMESCYLSLELGLCGIRREQIMDAVEFIEADSRLILIERSASLADFQHALIGLTPEEQTIVQNRWLALGVWPQPSKQLAEQAKQDSNKPRNEQRIMRVSAAKLDELVNQLGELVIATATLREQATPLKQPPLLETVAHIQLLVDDLQGCALQLRMVQIGDTFNRFNRVVRDIATELGKDIRLDIFGAETELDKSMVELISDPLMHLVRNAMDHGLETSAERLAKGKSAQGTLRLSAYHDSGSIVIEIADDGRGINRQKVLARAIDKGLVVKGANLAPHEIDELIFEPGFSTADAVSNLSGRGVGMDVVKKNIQALRGTIETDSREGEGSTFRLRLPLTLAIIDGFMVRVSDTRFVIPLDMVNECIECPDEASSLSLDADVLNLRGEVLPFLHLQHLFGLPTSSQVRRSIVIVRYGKEKAGLVVDQLIGEFQTVIKPLGKLFQPIEGISGSSILGSGDIAFILDVPKLIAQHIARKRTINA